MACSGNIYPHLNLELFLGFFLSQLLLPSFCVPLVVAQEKWPSCTEKTHSYFFSYGFNPARCHLLGIQFILKGFQVPPELPALQWSRMISKFTCLCSGLVQRESQLPVQTSLVSQLLLQLRQAVLGDLHLQHLRQQHQSVPNATLRGHIHTAPAAGTGGIFHACTGQGQEPGRAAEL